MTACAQLLAASIKTFSRAASAGVVLIAPRRVSQDIFAGCERGRRPDRLPCTCRLGLVADTGYNHRLH